MTNLNDQYNGFVDKLLSTPSSDFEAFIERLRELNGQGCDVPRLITGGVGLNAEAGELLEIIKKIVFQGKPYNNDNVFHMKRELSDIMFYTMTACQAINVSLDEVILENIQKLNDRYPGGFTVQNSEHRREGDL